MPYVQVRTTTALTKETMDAIKKEIGPAISLIPGKSEEGLMLEFVPECSIYMRGSDEEPAAFVCVLTNNEQQNENLRPYSAKVMEVISSKASIPMDRIYVVHEGLPKWHSLRGFQRDGFTM